VAPVDGDFPQLVRLHDRAHLADVLRATSALGRRDVSTEDVRVEAVRYRPGQRHVLRVGVGAGGPAWFAKVYRDDTGRRTVQAAMRAATAFAEAGDGAVDVAPPVGGYVAADRTAFWSEVPGMSLAEEIAVSACAASDLVRTAGYALRLLPEGLQVCPDASSQAGETLRTAQLIDALAPAVGSRLRREVGRALEWLTALPAEPPTLAHGDFKCDNLLVSGSRVHVLDFDRLGRGDPAADIGKFLADLRWCAGAQAGATERLHEAFRRGYGPADPARVARARAYDALLQLRMAARRVPIQDPEWEGRVVRAVGVAAATLDGAS
jgi:aminoglycoside phosphotransferase